MGNKKEKKKVDDKTKKVKVNEPKKQKKEKKEKKKHPKLWLAFKIIIALIILLVLIGAGIVAGIFMGFFGDDFKLSAEDFKVGNLNSEVYDREGNLIETLNGQENRKWIDIGDMSKYLPIAFVSIEDERFYEHQGVDIKRTATATIKYALSKVGIGDASYGGSTITQQLVKNLTKEDERDWTRKVKEMARAYNLEKEFSKQQILELYLNLIFLGGNEIHGVEMASQYYFSKSASDLSLAECAFLAGINSSPNYYEPFSDDQEDIDRIKRKTKIVLNKMKELGKIETEEDYQNAVAEVENGIAFKKGEIVQNIYSYHTDAAIDQIIDQLLEENESWSTLMAEQYLFGSGLKIYTTQNSWVQGIMEEEAAKEKYQVASDQVEGAVSQVAMVMIDHKTGQVVATVGGSGTKTTSRGYNFATMEPKQTGSSMKPLAVIAPAVQNGVITAGSVYDDIPTQFPGKPYGYPVNYYRGYKGLSTVRYAIQISQNIVPMRILNEMGIDKSIEFLKSAGITTLDDTEDRGLALALGGLFNGVTPLEMAGAYAAIANDGEYITPTFYTRVEDADGNVVLEPKQERRRILSVENAYIVKSILTAPVVLSGGTATYCKIPGIETCAKTGTTDKDYDRWLCGFTPYFTAATWFGYKENEPVHGFGGANPAGKFWDEVMTTAHEGLPNANFEKPQNITYATICRDSGLLATENCAQDPRGSRVYTEVYVKGTTPSKTCDCHVKVKVCTEDGTAKLANEYCPNAVEQVFITRKNVEDTSWQKAADAQYMLPQETCTKHTKPKEPEKKPENNTVTNTVTNSITNSTNTNKNNTSTNTTTNTNKNNTNTNTSTNKTENNTTNKNTNNVTNNSTTDTSSINQDLTNTIG